MPILLAPPTGAAGSNVVFLYQHHIFFILSCADLLRFSFSSFPFHSSSDKICGRTRVASVDDEPALLVSYFLMPRGGA